LPDCFSHPFRQAVAQLFSTAQRLCNASEHLLSIKQAEKLLTEVKDAVYRCRRVLNSAQLLEKQEAAGSHVRL
jgi:coenzyme F420-reducing hydrogenase alpha subunit